MIGIVRIMEVINLAAFEFIFQPRREEMAHYRAGSPVWRHGEY